MYRSILAGLHCLWPRLHDIKLPVDTILRPLHIHRSVGIGLLGIVVFYFDGIVRQHQNIFIRDTKMPALLFTGIDIFGVFHSDIAGIQLLGKHHFLFFLTQTTF